MTNLNSKESKSKSEDNLAVLNITKSRLLSISSYDQLVAFGRFIVNTTSQNFLSNSTIKGSNSLAKNTKVERNSPFIRDHLNSVVAKNAKAVADGETCDLQTSQFDVISTDLYIDSIPDYQLRKPCVSDFKCLSFTERNVIMMLELYRDYSTVEPEILLTLESKQRVQDMCLCADRFWDVMDKLDRQTWYRTLMGFPEFQDPNKPLENVQENIVITKKSAEIREYMRDQVSRQKIIALSKFPFKSGSFTADPLVAIPKADPGSFRVITTGQTSNKFTIKPPGLSSPSLETIFENDNLYRLLLNSQCISVYDYSQFFRQLRTDPSVWKFSAIVIQRNTKYLDLAHKMGSRSAPFAASCTSRMIDNIFNSLDDSKRNSVYALTLTDDRIVLNPSTASHSLLADLNDKFHLETHPEKTQERVEVGEWAGYVINCRDKTVKLKSKRIKSMIMYYNNLTVKKDPTRRDFAKFIGSVYSARLILFGLNLSLSPLLYYTRRFSALSMQFYDESELKSYQELYDTVLSSPPPAVINELNLALSVCKKEVQFRDIRASIIYKNHALDSPRLVNCETDSVYLTDASLDQIGGLTLVRNAANNLDSYAFSTSLQEFPLIHEDFINLKEYFASSVGQLFTLITRKNTASKDRSISGFVDNRAAQCWWATRRVNLVKEKLAILAKINEAIRIYTRIPVYLYRIDTHDNFESDHLSRMDIQERMENPAASLIYELFKQAWDESASVKFRVSK